MSDAPAAGDARGATEKTADLSAGTSSGIFFNNMSGGTGASSEDVPAAVAGAPLPSPRPMPAGYLAFSRACEPSERIVVAAVGDLLLHHELQIQATSAKQRFRVLWENVEDLLAAADLAYANLEVPLAAGVLRSGEEVADPGLVFDRKVYTAYPRFNVHPSLALDLVASGIDVVSTANNHALDRGALGVDKTLAALDAAKLPHTGTRARGKDGPWHAVTKAGSFTVAWLACTLHTNMVADEAGQVLRCFDSPTAVADAVRALARTPGIDAVIVTPHWGKEYAPTATKQQTEFARRWAEAGATAIVGNHPHVLQPWESMTTSDGREVLVAYSLGNFVSHQPELPKRSTAILYFGLGRAAKGPAFVTGAGYVPVHVRQTGDEFFAEAIDRVGGPADSRAHIVANFGAANLLAADKPIEVTPQCQPPRK
ncbi:CapA family protein [Nannocystis sp. ILAH1]|uniref:CapA family protein n=1 Tax=unclassified Nannocystis TaxID=2627009 RepID=UPI00226FFB63|nr:MULTISPECIES: CapA family protein [unclassified Nannocystis]MCY0992860.1 CapA family protein [Nannocystis sp. ILAH1]MCY1066302.1 CapA family protein [Nannocystis sp. RBIL2]